MARSLELPPVLIYEASEELSIELSQTEEGSCYFSFSSEKDLLKYLENQTQVLLMVGSPFTGTDLCSFIQKLPAQVQIDLLVYRELTPEEEEVCIDR